MHTKYFLWSLRNPCDALDSTFGWTTANWIRLCVCVYICENQIQTEAKMFGSCIFGFVSRSRSLRISARYKFGAYGFAFMLGSMTEAWRQPTVTQELNKNPDYSLTQNALVCFVVEWTNWWLAMRMWTKMTESDRERERECGSRRNERRKSVCSTIWVMFYLWRG